MTGRRMLLSTASPIGLPPKRCRRPLLLQSPAANEAAAICGNSSWLRPFQTGTLSGCRQGLWGAWFSQRAEAAGYDPCAYGRQWRSRVRACPAQILARAAIVIVPLSHLHETATSRA